MLIIQDHEYLFRRGPTRQISNYFSTQNPLSFLGLAEAGNDAKIFQGGGVAFDLCAGGNLLEEAPHDFSAAGFRQGFGESNVVGRARGSAALYAASGLGLAW